MGSLALLIVPFPVLSSLPSYADREGSVFLPSLHGYSRVSESMKNVIYNFGRGIFCLILLFTIGKEE
jgi:hypothetical protein